MCGNSQECLSFEDCMSLEGESGVPVSWNGITRELDPGSAWGRFHGTFVGSAYIYPTEKIGS